ncbi:RWD domain protein, partial [Teladorsagia circumcincta]
MEAEAEIEALRSIFGDEISVNSNHDRSLTTVRKKVRPNDEEGVSSASIVVEFELGPEYPDVSPKVRLFNPRGISEQSHHQLIEEVSQRLGELVGTPVMFDIIQSLRCPVCRVVIEEEVEPILQPPSPPPGRRRRASWKERETTPARRHFQQESHTDFEFDWERWRQQQASLMAIYERQKQKGGIIDMEEERKKNLVTEDTDHFDHPALKRLDCNRLYRVIIFSAASDAPPGFENVLPANPPPQNSHKRGTHPHHGRGRGRRFHDGHYRGGNRGGGHREHHNNHSQPGSVENEGRARDVPNPTITRKQLADRAGEPTQERR